MQPQIILQVLNQVNVKEKQGVKSTPIASTKILQRDCSAPLFCKDPCSSHGDAIIHLVKYLASTKNAGLILDPKVERIFKVHANTNFVGKWYKPTAPNNASSVKSISDNVISYARCPIIWASKLQMVVMLSTCKAEYVTLSTVLCNVIPMMQLLEEIQQDGIAIDSVMLKVHCKMFKDNARVLELAKAPKMRPHTKHINMAYHHFQSW
eukprot:426634-Ditylum_brightwellii.AAC.1